MKLEPIDPASLARVTTFATYEDREAAFGERLGALVPRMHLGPAAFWQDMHRIGFFRVPADTAWITSNPADCLAFGTARQNLAAAWLKAGPGPEPATEKVMATALAFGLEANLDQPVATLSGGEAVKLALAKTFVLAPRLRHLVIASPFSWLSQDNDGLFAKLLARCGATGQHVDIFSLDGESCRDPGPDTGLERLGFDLVLEELTLALGGGLGIAPTRVRVPALRRALASPCLLTGANGQGKSLMAKVLAGAIACRGKARIDRAGNGGKARLLFQDVLHQGLMRGLSEIARSAGTPLRANAWSIYEELGAGNQGAADPRPSLLAFKRMLTAVRLAAAPAALILDEPDWGLSRSAALAFVQAVIAAAHRRAIPVLMISHKPWWDRMAASRVEIRRTALDGRGFRIDLQ